MCRQLSYERVSNTSVFNLLNLLCQLFRSTPKPGPQWTAMALNNTKHLLFHENPDVIKTECLFLAIVTNGGPAHIELLLNGDTLEKLSGLLATG